MVQFTNFYESLAEARMRLRKSIVCYNGLPYYVLEIFDHADGKFRIYLQPLDGGGIGRDRDANLPDSDYYPGNCQTALEKYMQDNPNCGILRKYMSAAGFNKYRPFPLGNVNHNGHVYYLERTPTRNTFQGLRSTGVVAEMVTAVPSRETKTKLSTGFRVDFPVYSSAGFADCIAGNYPSYQEVVAALRNDEVTNSGCAFHREFSVLRGPVNSLCLCYQTEGVGLIFDDKLVLGNQYKYLYEQIQELKIFNIIDVV